MPKEQTRYQCTEGTCRRSYATKSALGHHVKQAQQETKRLFACRKENCQRVYLTEYGFQAHLQKDHSTHICRYPSCTQEFADKAAYQDHLATHRIYICSRSDCAASYSTKKNLKRHTREKHSKFRSSTKALPSSDAATGADFQPSLSPEPIPDSPYGKVQM